MGNGGKRIEWCKLGMDNVKRDMELKSNDEWINLSNRSAKIVY